MRGIYFDMLNKNGVTVNSPEYKREFFKQEMGEVIQFCRENLFVRGNSEVYNINNYGGISVC